MVRSQTRYPTLGVGSRAVALAFAWGLPLACTGGVNPDEQVLLAEGGALPTFGQGACAGCITEHCADEVRSCARRPDCAAALRCRNDCPALENGPVDPACSGACASPPAGAGADAFADMDECTLEATARCSACGGTVTEAGPASDAASSVDAARPNPILGQSCASPPDGDACEVCKETYCCETRARCRDDADCNAFADCMELCNATRGYTECTVLCDETAASGHGPFETQFTCAQVFCSPECLGVTPAGCLACTFEQCLVPLTTCQSNVECARLAGCIELCTTGACQAECIAQYPGGQADASALAACGESRCVDSCL